MQLLSMTATRSQIWSMTFISCVMTMIVTPSVLLISRSSSRMERVVLGSSALVASSHSRYRGLVASARAIATRCFCPPDSCEGKLAALSARPTTFSSSSARFFASAFGVPEISSGKQTLRRTDRCSSRLKLWKIMPICRRTCKSAFSLSAVRFCPSTQTSPEVGRSSRLMQRTSVDLPAPDRPMIPKISPSAMVRFTSFSASTLPEAEE